MLAGLLIVLAGCSPKALSPSSPGPEAVYRQYLDAFRSLTSLEDRAVDRFLSEEAKRKLADIRLHPAPMECDPCPTPEQAVRMAKTMRPYPHENLRPVVSENERVVTLTWQWHEPPGTEAFGDTGGDISVTVELVQEQGWKLKSESWSAVENPGTARIKGAAGWSY